MFVILLANFLTSNNHVRNHLPSNVQNMKYRDTVHLFTHQPGPLRLALTAIITQEVARYLKPEESIDIEING